MPYKTLEEAKTYLFAVDGSDPSRHVRELRAICALTSADNALLRQAMNYMMCLVRPGVDKIVLVSVADAAGAEDSEKGRKIAKAVASTMHHYVIQLCERSITVETRVLYTSDSAGKAICDETAREGTNYCMLVLGSRGLGSIKRYVELESI